MKNQQIIKIFLILFLSTIAIFSASHFGASAYEAMTVKKDQFVEGTMIGSLSVAGLTPEEATTLLSERITTWKNGATFILKYREKSNNLQIDHFKFDIEQSVLQAQQGQTNPLIVILNPFDEVLSEISPDLSQQIQLEQLKTEILNYAYEFTTGEHEIRLDDFLVDGTNANVTIAETVINDDYISLFDQKKIEILPNEQFSFLNYLEENKQLPSLALNKISSAIYELILQTNFTILERNISSELPDGIKLGFEVKFDQKQGNDLVFYNPNDFSYFIQFTEKDNELTVSLKGPEFLTKYVVITEDEESFEPKIIRQFNPQLGPAEIKVKTEGKHGQLIKVYREHRDEKGKVLKKEFISEDFYPPIHQVEIQGLIPDESETDLEEYEQEDEIQFDDNDPPILEEDEDPLYGSEDEELKI